MFETIEQREANKQKQLEETKAAFDQKVAAEESKSAA